MCTNHITDSLTDWIPSQVKASYSYSCTSPDISPWIQFVVVLNSIKQTQVKNSIGGLDQERNSDPLINGSIVVEFQEDQD